MRAVTLTQPWATLVILGLKRIETRSWPTGHRGPLVIHAAKGWSGDDRDFAVDLQVRGILPVEEERTAWALQPYPVGMALGTVRLVDVVRLTPSRRQYSTDATIGAPWEVTDLERELGDYSDGRYGWLLADPEPFAEPVACKGALGLWRYDGAMP